jgi:hypothetical protein
LYTAFTAGTTIFQTEDFIFIITGSGEIFRGYITPIKDDKINILLTPCYGISNYSRPLNKRITQI